jgi:hypothetical protein
MIEDGDRHHGAESARLENGVDGVCNAHDHVVIEFVLDNHVNKLGSRLAGCRPSNHLAERRHRAQFFERIVVSHGGPSSCSIVYELVAFV